MHRIGHGGRAGCSFPSSAEIEAAAQAAGLDATTTAPVVDDHEAAQLQALKAGLLAAALIALASLAFTGNLPTGVQATEDDAAEARSSRDGPATAAA